MHIVDSHAHLDFASLSEDLDGVLARAMAAEVRTILAVGIGDGPGTMHRALGLAKRFDRDPSVPRIVASAGIHPQEAEAASAEALEKLRALAADPLVVAIGEIGLDYYHLENPEVAVQKAAFVAQMEIAREVRRPILIHLRTSELATPEAKARFGSAAATEDFFALVEEHWVPHGIGCVMHCFSGTAEQAARALGLGFYISFAGNVTYSRFQSTRDAALIVPLERMLVETDSPFLAPVPYRGERNEPARARVTAEFVAGLRGIPVEAIAAATTANFERLFGMI